MAANVTKDRGARCDLGETATAKRLRATVPHRPTDIPHPQRYEIRQPIAAERRPQSVAAKAIPAIDEV
jgi:hypothetical protein